MDKKGKDNSKIEGIGGWLMLFVVISFLGIISSVYYFINTLNGVQPDKGIFLIGDLFQLIFIILALFFIFKKSRKAKAFSILSVWSGAFVLISYIISIYATGKILDMMQILVLLIQSIVYVFLSIVWTAYFLMSKRVKNTFVN